MKAFYQPFATSLEHGTQTNIKSWLGQANPSQYQHLYGVSHTGHIAEGPQQGSEFPLPACFIFSLNPAIPPFFKSESRSRPILSYEFLAFIIQPSCNKERSCSTFLTQPLATATLFSVLLFYYLFIYIFFLSASVQKRRFTSI